MIDGDIRSALDECLDALELGASIDDALARYPDHADELRPLLVQAMRLRTLPGSPPPSTARSDAARLRYLRRAAELRRERLRRTRRARAVAWLRSALAPTRTRVAQAVASFSVSFVAIGAATVWTATSAGADSPLYGLKLLTEDVRQNFTYGDRDRAELSLGYLDTRERELRDLLAAGDAPGKRLLDRIGENADDAVAHALRSGDRDLLADVERQLDEQARLLLFAAPHLEGDTATRVTVLLDDISAGRDTVARRLIPSSAVEVRGRIPEASGLQFGTARRIDSRGGVVEEEEGGARVLRVGGQKYKVAPGVEVSGGKNERLVVVNGDDGEPYIVAAAPEIAEPEKTARITGRVTEATSRDFWIGDTRILIDDSTLIVAGSITAGAKVAVEGVRDANGDVRALEVEVLPVEEPPAFVHEGIVENWDGQRWVIDGMTFVEAGGAAVDLHALEADESPIGKAVRVEAVEAADGTYTIRRLWTGIALEPTSTTTPQPEPSATTAPIEEAESSGAWEVEGTIVSFSGGVIELGAGGKVRIGALTQVFGSISEGARVVMEVRRNADGATVAITVRVVSAPSTPTPTPTPSVTASPAPSAARPLDITAALNGIGIEDPGE